MTQEEVSLPSDVPELWLLMMVNSADGNLPFMLLGVFATMGNGCKVWKINCVLQSLRKLKCVQGHFKIQSWISADNKIDKLA